MGWETQKPTRGACLEDSRVQCPGGHSVSASPLPNLLQRARTRHPPRLLTAPGGQRCFPAQRPGTAPRHSAMSAGSLESVTLTVPVFSQLPESWLPLHHLTNTWENHHWGLSSQGQSVFLPFRSLDFSVLGATLAWKRPPPGLLRQSSSSHLPNPFLHLRSWPISLLPPLKPGLPESSVGGLPSPALQACSQEASQRHSKPSPLQR